MKNNKTNFFQKGFTLIELLVVISIIGILVSLTLVSYTGAQKQARDTQRRSDLNQYRNAVENYASSNNGLYPLSLNAIDDLCDDYLLSEYIGSCPVDPITTQPAYGFYSSASGDAYVIYAKLETDSGYWEVCSIGKSGKVDDVPTSATDCDL
jgi:prepilin-type N-terminal cleavage/methylation domain-containing protein